MSKLDTKEYYHCGACGQGWIKSTWILVKKRTTAEKIEGEHYDLIMCPYCSTVRGAEK